MGIFDWFFGKKKTTSESTFEEKKEDLNLNLLWKKIGF